ncbi:hypothetical protein B7494_g1960 [Chlorociboria aeruginascens]|nr:hypothetical protein B7494_g1960 [Chlorociboria aeruginascens]
MAPHVGFGTDLIKDKARKDLLYLLQGVRGKKNLVIEKSLAGPLGIFVKFSTLQDHGVDKVFFLENGNADVSQRNVVFIARGETARHAQSIADHIRRMQRESQTGHEFSVFWVPRRTLVSEKILEEAGVLGDTNIAEFPLYFIPLENDLLSLELDESFGDLYLRKDPTPTFLLARALMLIQQKHGLFPRITGKGDNAKKLADLLARMRQELIAGEDTTESNKLGLTPSNTIESLIVVDREVDYATPLLTQLTYEGLIDEVVGIEHNQADVDSSIVGAAPQPAQGSQKAVGTPTQLRKRKIQLDSSDKLYDQLRDTNFAIVGNLLNKVARRLQTDYDSRHGTKNTAELREFVNKLPGYQAEQQSLKIHTGLAEEILKHTRTDQFSKLLEVQQNIAAGADPSSQHDAIEELIAREAPLSEVLRLLCLESCISGGIKPRELENFKRMILQGYGYQHLLTLDALEKLQLLLSRTSPMASMIPMSGSSVNTGTKTNYTYLRKQLRLIVDEVNEQDPNDIAYVYSGYAPLSVRLVQCILQKQYLASITRGGNANHATGMGGASQGWRGFDEPVKHVRGQTFDEVQKGEDKAVKARALLTSSGEKKMVFVVFLGGITFTEIAALRFIAKKEEGFGGRLSWILDATGEIPFHVTIKGRLNKHSSAIADLDPDDHSYISKSSPEVTRLKVSDMAATMDAQIPQPDDMLMGLQELDSQFAIFESPHLDGNQSTPCVVSNYEEPVMTIEEPAYTIIVDSTGGRVLPKKPHTQMGSRSKSSGTKSTPGGYKQPGRPSKHASDSSMYLRPESARDSLASSMITDHDDNSSALSSVSSKGTSPPASSREPTKSISQNGSRQTYDVRPKVSIPTDIAPSEYARQCIAAAESSRLNPYSLHPEEHALLRSHLSHSQVTNYLNIRNGILRLWTRNPMIGVMRDEAIGCAKDVRWFDVARICHEWLARRGYINYGCLEHIGASRETKKSRPGKRKQRTIAVIGAGMAGLGCARQIEGLVSQFQDSFHAMGEDPPRVIVLEGRDRIGGRVYSRAFTSKSKYPTLNYGSRHTAELGGMIITGFDRGNPLNIIVRGQLALPYHSLRPETTIYDATGRPVDTNRDQYAEKLFNYILDRVSEYKFKVSAHSTVDGDKSLLDTGRDTSAEIPRTTKTISEVEDSSTTLPQSTLNPAVHADEVQMIPVSSDRLTGRPHLEPGVPGVHTAAYKAKEIGWLLKPGVGIESDLDLERAVSSKYATLGTVFDEAIRQYARIVDFTPLDLRLINWHVANLEYSNAITCNKLSLGGWDLDAGNEWEGKHTMVTGGYQQVPRGLLYCPQPLSVRKKSIAKRIVYSHEHTNIPSKIECEDGEAIEADYIVSTIPLGVLKRQEIQFEPPLPEWKMGAIQRVGFGVLNKVILVYKEPFWDQNRDIFGTLRNPANRFSLEQADYFSQRGRFFQWFNCTKTSGLPTLLGLMAGDAAFYTEKTPDDELIAEATKVLTSVFGPSVPTPIEAVVTRWGRDTFSRGSYSYTGPNFRPDDYEVMARPVGNLFFAGEHTCGTHPATVHGAYISGLRAASEVLEAMIGPIDIPQPLILPKDSALKRKAEAIQSPKDPKQARLEAYDIEIWNAIYTKLGDRPWRPANNYANPYRMYSKDKWDEAKRKCEEGRRPGKGKPIPNEVKKMVTKMWKEASGDVKQPYNEMAEAQKKVYADAMAEYNTKAAEWDKEALAFRVEYVKEHPSVPGPDERVDSQSRRDRRAKRIGGYAEDSGSEPEH